MLRKLGRGCLTKPIVVVTTAAYLSSMVPRAAAAAEEPAVQATAPAREVATRAAGSERRAVDPTALGARTRGLVSDLGLPTTGFGSEATNQGLSLPQAPATVQGMGESFNVSLITGGATLQIPIAVPPGRGLPLPQLGLAYDSSSGRGVAGAGWDFGNVFVSRELAKGVPRYQDPPLGGSWQPGQDRFAFGSDELVAICLVQGGTCSGLQPGEAMPAWANGWQYFRPAVERNFLRYFWSADHRTWRAQAKSGVILELGAPLAGPVDATDAAAIESDPGNPSRIFRWRLSRQFDSQDATALGSASQPVNLVVYRYFADHGISYLQDVYDTPPASGAASAPTTSYAHHVHASYEARPDPWSSYQPGWLIVEGQRLTRVDVTSQPFLNAPASRELLRRYELSYDPQSHVSLLTSVQVEGRCAPTGQAQVTEDGEEHLPWPTNCPTLPALGLGYTHVADSSGQPIPPPPGFESFEGIATNLQSITQSPPYSYGDDQVSPYDIDGDGLPDLLVTAPGQFGGHSQGAFLNGTGGQIAFGGVVPVTMAPSTDPAVASVTTSVLELTNPNVAPLDVDGDGIMEMLHMPVSTTYTVFSPISAGTGFQWSGRSVTVPTQQVPEIDFTHWSTNTRVLDVDNDGLVDIVHITGTEVDTYFGLGRYPSGDGQFGTATWTGATTANLSTAPARSCVPWSSTPISFGDADTYVADMNGDGLLDIVRVRQGDVRYWPGRGNGFWGTGDPATCLAGTMGEGRAVAMSGSPPTVNVGDPVRLDDVNGDGLADIVRTLYGAIEIWLNVDGTSWTTKSDVIKGPYSSQIIDQVRLLDINGSGTKDVVWGAAGAFQYIDLQGGQRPWLLQTVQNGLGKTTQISYESSVQLMLDAQARKTPWQSVMPFAVPVVTKVVETDNLGGGGALGSGTYEVDYQYADPLYDGQRREFRGFRTTTVTQVGDANQPTEVETTTSLQGACVSNPSDGYDVCAPSERWRDNPREALKGLPLVRSVQDAHGVTFSTAHHGYVLQALYSGVDGHSVNLVYENETDTWTFETSPFVAGSGSVPVVDLTDLTHGGQTSANTVSLASSQYAHLRGTATWDNFGNVASTSDSGCVDGSACPAPDEIITKVTTFQRSSADATGWAWRSVEDYVSGSQSPGVFRHHAFYDYDAAGHLQSTRAVLQGSLALDRHDNGAQVAGAPPTASTDGEVTFVTLRYDPVLGNLLERDGGAGRCRTVTYDTEYAVLPVTETVLAGPVVGACGTVAIATRADYDRGLATITALHGANGEFSTAVYDGHGRPISISAPDPVNPRVASPQPSLAVEYLLPGASPDPDYSIVHSKSQNGSDPSVASYLEKWTFVDGMGRPRATIEQADVARGDGGAYAVGGWFTVGARALPLRRFRPSFWNGSPLAFPLRTFAPSTSYSETRADALGRTTAVVGLDALLQQRIVFHVLSVDNWDAEDLKPGQHQGTFTTATSDGHSRRTVVTERLHVNGVVEAHDTVFSYLPSGEVASILRRRNAGTDAPVVRWMGYDSLGRRVLTAEPDGTGFSATPPADLSTVVGWRYAYDDAGALVGTSDPRGCGENMYRDGAGRLVAEDYSPCQPDQAPYSPPDPSTQSGFEAYYLYDSADPESTEIVDGAGRALAVDSTLYNGRVASISDRAGKTILAYDGRGRTVGVAKRMAKPSSVSDPTQPYAPRWYVRTAGFDAAGHVVAETTGSTVSEMAGTGGESATTSTYSVRGFLAAVGSSHGALINGFTRTAEGLVTLTQYGDEAGTQRSQSYDANLRPSTRQTYRGTPTLWSSPSGSYSPPSATPSTTQLLLEDVDFTYDRVGNVTSLRDYRLANEWPLGAQPVTRQITYDDLYRVVGVNYEYPGGVDPWTSPFAAENQDPSREQPVPQVAFSNRIVHETFNYDWLGNTVRTDDDSHGFYDRSLGTVTNGTALAGPYQLLAASNRGATGGANGDLVAGYDAAGNLSGLIVQRDGACLPGKASCSQQYAYSWDEVGRLASATRWDLLVSVAPSLDGPLPSFPPAAQLVYTYDASGQRASKAQVAPNATPLYDLFVFDSFELRQTTWGGGDYDDSAATECPYLEADGQRLARVVFDPSVPSISGGGQHVYMLLEDSLGSNHIVIDQATGELVESATYTSYGSGESDYRPARWDSFRERHRFTGKEDDMQVGLMYFGQRYYAPALNRWISLDPMSLHNAESDLNPYAYVRGQTFVATDPNGELAFLIVIAIAAIVGAVIGGGANATAQLAATGHVNWGSVAVAAAIGAAAGALIGATSGAAGMSLGQSLLLVPKAFVSGTGLVGLFNAMGSGAIIGTTSAGITGANPSQTALGGLLGEVGGAMGYGTSLAFQKLDALIPPSNWKTLLSVGEWMSGGKLIEVAPHFASAMAAMNGGFSGGRSIYDFKDGTGFLAFAVDSSWSLDDTMRGNVFQFMGAKYDANLSVNSNRTIYDYGGWAQGFAGTEGNVTINIAEAQGANSHEGMHVFQSRVGGPVFFLVYAPDSIIGGYVGIGVWAVNSIQGHPKNLFNDVEWWGYYQNWLEMWAYGQNPSAFVSARAQLNP
jgi:RHS repeat-associated protein